MSTSPSTRTPDASLGTGGFPWGPLLIMALAGFILIATETMPAGLLPQIASGMDITEGAVGLYVRAYALGTVLVTIPAITLTRGMSRKPLLIFSLSVFLAANSITALSENIVLSLATRFVAGACSGLLWGMLAGYARRITAPQLAGRALSIASLGTPIGLAVGTPFGSWLGTALDWRWSFGALSILTTAAIALVIFFVPPAAGQPAETQAPLLRVAALPGIAVILAVVVAWMLAHNTMYTYISAYLRSANTGLSVDVSLILFGVAALGGIWLTGLFVDRALRVLVLVSIALFAVAGVVFIVGNGSTVAIISAIALWGLAFGGAAAQLQTAIGEASGENADVANGLLGVSFNLAIFGAGLIGAVLISGGSGLVLPLFMVALALVALAVAALARRTGFPAGR
ncbi:MFS transporter [Pseudarthrobacter sp. PS3-L1]|uniref:MFS transporter n=1 Tax=Pseudarthrobacter sp. PS3-L1 TaxID=3046207 RepID=UPI0024BB98C4|nr:MFS transporter [Pseudarthrobacter sp. PS3-L1]MDJ0320848.1 MFS transporter [Pseudarthrobacter sp. PS3-L1]